MRVCAYTRISTSEQRNDLQVEEIRQYCERRGFTIVCEHSDTISGSQSVRPGLKAVMAGARRRSFDAVIVWRFDRMARSLAHLVTTLEELDALGIQFVSVREAVDTTLPIGRLLFQIIGGLAEFERSLINERVKAGIESAKRRGVRFGRPRSAVDPERVRRMRAAGASFPQIAKALETSVGTAHRICAASARP